MTDTQEDPDPDVIGFEHWILAGALAAITAGAMWVSWQTLYDAANNKGVPHPEAWAGLLDTFAAAMGLTLYLARRRGEDRQVWTWALLLSATLMSSLLQGLDSWQKRPEDPLALAMHLLPAWMAIAAFERLLRSLPTRRRIAAPVRPEAGEERSVRPATSSRDRVSSSPAIAGGVPAKAQVNGRSAPMIAPVSDPPPAPAERPPAAAAAPERSTEDRCRGAILVLEARGEEVTGGAVAKIAGCSASYARKVIQQRRREQGDRQEIGVS